jgi:ATP-dependent helicase Lhr and Lhr-like helicase
VSAFDRLHPALQHHVVNSLGWRELRPLQESSITPILDGRHALLLAPTAGGKTEAALFPALSRMLSENWSGLSILYVCPLKALLNNLHLRLQQYCQWVGRTCALWHGDISQGTKAKVLKEPADILLTTPESLEVMLISNRVDKRVFFGNLRLVVVDELHAFAGDDRGWHLLSVLERLTRLAGREIQRVGLSATIGNPTELLDWLAGHCEGHRELVVIPAASALRQEVQVDYVGNLENAATVISRLHVGEKRLVFCDSRSRVEQLASYLRRMEVATFVSHSSLSVEERHSAELAFAQSSNCVIVATSTLELGIDVGDLDRVIQIDATPSVASFLQRLGRTGRRPETLRNCLFLATDQESLIQAIAIVEQWREGYVEPIRPPVMPLHLLAHQIMALALQEKVIGTRAWQGWLLRLPAFAGIPDSERDAVVKHMLHQGYLQEDGGKLWLGAKGEEDFGYRNFMELFSVFTSTPEFSVYWGRQHLGSVHESTFLTRSEGPIKLSLAGKSWRVEELDWSERTVFVSPERERGISRWLGLGRSLPFDLCRKIRTVLTAEAEYPYLARRATAALGQAREEFCWLKADAVCVRTPSGEDRTEIWTYAGQTVNSSFANALIHASGKTASADNFRLRLNGVFSPDVVQQWFSEMRELGPMPPAPTDLAAILERLKFRQCLPEELAERMLSLRLMPAREGNDLLEEQIVFVHFNPKLGSQP